jgi:hypothetical protein
MGGAFNSGRPKRGRHPGRLSMAAGVALVAGLGMAALAPLFAQSPFVLGPITGIGTLLIILIYG